MTDGNVERFKLSPRQNYLWQLQQDMGHHPFFCQARVALHGPLDQSKLSTVIHTLVEQNEILRTTFEIVEGMNQPLQSLHASYSVAYQQTDLSGIDPRRVDEQLDRLAIQAVASLDQPDAPPIQFLLATLVGRPSLLIITASPLCLDGPSMTYLTQELARLWQGKPRDDDDEPLPFVNISEWQQEMLAADESELGREYWRKQNLLSFPNNSLPFESGNGQHFEPLSVRVPISGAPAAAIDRLATELATEPARVVMAAWAILLTRMTLESEMILCIAQDGRTGEELTAALGPLEHYLPLPVRLNASMSFKDLVIQIGDLLEQAQEWQDYFNWEQIASASEHSFHPPYPTFSFEHLNRDPLRIGRDLLFDLERLTTCTDRFKVKCCLESSVQPMLSLQFDGNLIDKGSAERMILHLFTLLEQASISSAVSIHKLMVGGPEQDKLIARWNATSRTFERSSLLHTLAESGAQGRETEVALTVAGQELTHGALHRRANQIARFLQQKGIGPECPIGLCMERCIELSPAILGIMKVGATYVPLDPDLPPKRLHFIIENAGITIVLTMKEFASIFAGKIAHTFCLDRDHQEFDEQRADPLNLIVDPRQTAYIIYTSGSTGIPKGVALAHQAAANHMHWMEQAFAFSDKDRFLHKAAISFDASIWELIVPLMVGGRMVMARPHGHTDPVYLNQLIREEELTVVQNVPTMLNALSNEETFAKGNSVRLFLCAGEALPTSLMQKLYEHKMGQLINMYGPTEASIDVTWWPCQQDYADITLPIGKPIDNTSIQILNPHLVPMPLATPGQLYIGGLNLARGYVGRPALTAEKFIPDPFASKPGSRLYASGDLASFAPDGNLSFHGRIDDQVKYHGYRIELGEIENALMDHPVVRQATVMVREDVIGEQQLVAYVIAGLGITKEDLRNFMLDRLPDYMVPSGFIVLDALPLTSSGKVDRKQLPIPDFGADRDHAYIAPQTDVEKVLVSVWQEVLKLDRVGIQDNYFTLGGDSIRSINLVGKAADHDLEFTVQELFDSPTIEKLAPLVRDLDPAKLASRKTAPFSLITDKDRQAMPDDVEDAYPLTMLQSGMIYFSELHRETAAFYNVNNRLVEGPLDENLFRMAVEMSISCHTALRTSIHYTGFSEPLQLVHRQIPVPLRIFDLSQMSEEEKEREIKESFQRQRFTRFDLVKPPLFRLELFRLSENLFRVVHTDHHAILDGWSVATLNTELINAYTRLIQGLSMETRTPKVLFRDYVKLENQARHSPSSRAYWEKTMAGVTPLKFPRDLVPDPGQESEGMAKKVSLIHQDLPEVLSDALKATANRLGVPLKSLCMAVHLRVLAHLTGCDDIVSGFSSNGRLESEDGERVLGLFLNALPFRMRLNDHTESWQELIARCFKREKELISHRRFPLGEIQQMVGVGDLFEISFNYIEFHVYQETKDEVGFVFKENMSSHTTNFTLLGTFSLHPFKHQAALDVNYNTTIISEDQAVQVAKYYLAAVRALVADPSRPHSEANLMSPIAYKRLLTDWNSTARNFDSQPDISGMIAAHAQDNPAAPAVIFLEQTYSRGDINRRANQLAHHLISLGVGPEARVATFFKRTPEMVIAIIAVIRAGATYLPIDPELPENRLAHMLADSEARVVLTNREHASLLPDGPKVVSLDGDAAQIETNLDHDPGITIYPDQLVYLIYTSGSTGLPKGVGISHRALHNYVEAAMLRFDLGEDDAMGMLSTVAADLGNTCLFGALCTGRPLRLIPQNLNLDANGLINEFDERPLDCLKLVPSHLHALLAAPRAEALLPRKLLILGGEKLDASLVKQVRALLPECRVINHYGPTEATIGALTQAVDNTIADEMPVIPIGRPIANMGSYVLDKRLKLVPAGATGELFLSGTGLARGYLGHPALTAERFVPSPYHRSPGERMYRTGDLVRQIRNGQVLYLGRSDHQVKIRGYRVELSEIELVLKQHEQVRDAVVILHHDDSDLASLAAYIVLSQGEISRSELRTFLTRSLPDYMIPTNYLFIEQLPLNANGKLDRRALPSLDKALSQREIVLPRTPTEATLAEIWQDVLQVEAVGVTESFFQQGGNSLLAMLVVTRVRDAYELDVSVQTLFEAKTIEELALRVEALREENALLSAVSDVFDDQKEDEEFTI